MLLMCINMWRIGGILINKTDNNKYNNKYDNNNKYINNNTPVVHNHPIWHCQIHIQSENSHPPDSTRPMYSDLHRYNYYHTSFKN